VSFWIGKGDEEERKKERNRVGTRRSLYQNLSISFVGSGFSRKKYPTAGKAMS
jgi:hypothetical protein